MVSKSKLEHSWLQSKRVLMIKQKPFVLWSIKRVTFFGAYVDVIVSFIRLDTIQRNSIRLGAIWTEINTQKTLHKFLSFYGIV